MTCFASRELFMENRFALIIISFKVSNPPSTVKTKEGDRFWLCNGEWGETCSHYKEEVPEDIKTFKSRESASKFGKEFEGHPWWVVTKDFEIVELEPNMVTKQEGWRIAEPLED